MAMIKAMVWSVLSGSFIYLYMTEHVVKANLVMIIWIALFSWEFVVSTKKYNCKEGSRDGR